MTDKPHQRPEFRNAVTDSVTVTITVEGGKRRGTADRRARKAAERLANTAARIPGIVAVSASAGCVIGGEVVAPERVRFTQANTGHGTYSEPDKLNRYLDPKYERALASLAEENAAAERRRRADRDRRRSVGCQNTYALIRKDTRHCRCIYCQPDDHYFAAQRVERHGHSPFLTNLCLCGTPVATFGERCLLHRGVEVAVLDGDGSALQLLAKSQGLRSADHAQPHEEHPDPRLEL